MPKAAFNFQFSETSLRIVFPLEIQAAERANHDFSSVSDQTAFHELTTHGGTVAICDSNLKM